MANLSLVPRAVKKEITDGWTVETWKIILLSSAHVPNAVTQVYASDVIANEITDGGSSPKYTAGGVPVTGKVSVADGNNEFIDAPDVVIGTGASLNYRYGVIIKDTGNQATSPIRAQIDFLVDQIVVNGTSTIQWNALGIIYLN